MAYNEILQIMIPGIIVLVCALMYNHNSKNMYKVMGELEYRVRVSTEAESRLKIKLSEKDVKIAEMQITLEERGHEIDERKQDTRSLRSIMNRNEGRISVYEENEASYMKELSNLRTSTLIAQAKVRGLEEENARLLEQVSRFIEGNDASGASAGAL